MRVLCHAQHLTGVGHFVRMSTIAAGLCAAHEVHLVDGGRPVPSPGSARMPSRVPLPRLTRRDGRLAADGDERGCAAVLAERARTLAAATERIRPDVLLVDHYPFGKWELAPEIAAAVEAARRARPGARIVCSIRDIVRHDPSLAASRADYEAGVLARLAEHFDALWIHGDPAFTRIEEHFGRAAELPVRVSYTGFVGRAPPAPAPAGEAPFAVLSCGGGARSLPFLLAAIEAFRGLAAAGALGRMTLEVFAGAFATGPELDRLRSAARDAPVVLRSFSPGFAERLAASALSISRAGYNTSVLLLRTGLPAVLVPNSGVTDQVPRARRFAALRLATVVEQDPPKPAAIAAAIEAALAQAPPRPAFDLEGVAATCKLVEGACR